MPREEDGASFQAGSEKPKDSFAERGKEPNGGGEGEIGGRRNDGEI